MDDLSQRLQALLSSPDSLAKLQGALTALGAKPDSAAPSAPPSSSAPPPSADSVVPDLQKDTPSAEASAESVPDLSSLAGLLSLLSGLGGSDGGGAPELGGLLKLLPLLSASGKEDENTALLRALRPYLHGGREKRLDGAIKLLQISRILPLLK